MSTQNVTKAASSGTPWALMMVVGLLIAKFGFGVPIAWLWVLAPLWIPFAFGLVVLFGIGMVALLIFLGALGHEALKRRPKKPRLV